MKTHHKVRVPFWKYRYDEIGDQHALCDDIRPDQLHKTILSCIRNPFDLYVSEYTYKWWKRFPHLWFHDAAAIVKAYPKWRDFTFEEFISVSNRQAEWAYKTLVRHPAAEKLGWYSHKFIYYYCRNHDYVFDAVGDTELLVKRARESAYPVHFLHMEQLNHELFDFLRSKGYAGQVIDFIQQKGKINTSRKNHDYRQWYSDKMRREIEERDALIFRLFPDFQF